MAEINGEEVLVVMVPHINLLKTAISKGKIIKKSGNNVKTVALVSPSVSMEARNELTEVYDMVILSETLNGNNLGYSSLLLNNLNPWTLNFENNAGNQEAIEKKLGIEETENRNSYRGNVLDEKSNWVAIVGMSARFPQANSVDEYWELLVNGENTCSTPPVHRTKLVDMDPDIKGNFLKCPIDQFDATFFGISPTEATFTDPQARLILEVSWEALEDAGINPDDIRGTKGGVFYGSWLQEYKEDMNENCSQTSQDFIRKYKGNGLGSTAAKISFFYGTTGPNIATESGCSSSVIGIDLACKSLQRKECTIALACGANLILHLNKQDAIWAEDGKSKTFDVGANGYSRAEGIAVLVLKRYSDAILDNDNIHGIIRGIGTSQEGLSKSFGTPTIQCEYDCMREALVTAKVTPTQVDYVEAHATGTAVGDPIEAAAIVKAYHSGSTTRDSPLIIGSGKTNVGHTESCSAMAGIIKVLLSMKNELIPKHVNFTKLNPQIDFSPIPGIIPLEPTPWPRKPNDRPRIAGVSSFGITGTDVHVILQEPPIKGERRDEDTPPHARILTLSAKSDIALEQMTNQFLIYLEASVNEQSIQDITYTANVCRAHHPIRRAVVGSSVIEMITNIRTGCNMYTSINVQSNFNKICFTFPGITDIMPMSLEPIRQLYRTTPFFKEMMDLCDQIFKQVFPESAKSLLETLLNSNIVMKSPKGMEWCALLVSYQVSLAKLWNKWGIVPTLVMGHSFGEFSAAVVCGALELKEIFEIFKMTSHYFRSQYAEPTSMMAIATSEQSVEKIINKFNQTGSNPSDWIDIAVVNSDLETIVVGPKLAITAFQQHCMRHGIKINNVSCDHSTHSRAIETACQKSLEALNKLVHHPIKIPYISSVTGELVNYSELSGLFWYKVLRNGVNFKQACLYAMNTKMADIFLEIGLDESLTKHTKANLEKPQTCLNFMSSFPKKEYGIYNTLAEMYATGIHVKWDYFHGSVQRNKVSLPHYPFQRKSYWYERKPRSQLHPLLGPVMEVPPISGNLTYFRNDNFLLEDEKTNFVNDHRIDNKVILPGACFLEMILSSWKLAMKLENISTHSVEKFVIHEPLLIDKSSPVSSLTAVNKDNGNVLVYTTNGSESKWRLHATADVIFNEQSAHQLGEKFRKDGILDIVDDIESEEIANKFYFNASKFGLNFGPAFKSLKRIYKTENGDMLAEVKDLNLKTNSFCCHPILIDVMIQGFMVHTKPAISTLHVPIKIDKFIVSSTPSNKNKKLFLYSQNGSKTVYLVDQTGQVIALMKSPEVVATTVENVLAAAGNIKSHVLDSISIYEVYWKQSKFYQPEIKDLPSETLEAEYQNELSELVSKCRILNDFSHQEARLDETMNQLCYLYVVKALFDIGWVQEVRLNNWKWDNSPVSIQEKWGILPGLVKAFNHFVCYLNDNKQHFNETTLEQVEFKIQTILELPIIKGYDAMKTIQKCGWNLAGILQGNVSLHNVLFGEDNLAEHYYRTSRFAKSHVPLEKLFTFFATKQTAAFGEQHTLKILEVGAGTGVFTKRITTVFKEMGVKFHYHFTDISRTLVSRAKKTFEEDSKDFTFKILNIEMDPLKQGFPAGYFDIVFALNVLHATRNLIDTLRNIQMITKLGGVLLLGETEKPVREADIGFGGFDGYWLFEDDIRKSHCTISSDTWLQIMVKNGFSGHPCQILSCGGHFSAIAACKTDEKISKGKVAEWVVIELEKGSFSQYQNLMESITNRNFTIISLDTKMTGKQLQGYMYDCLLECNGDLEGVLVWLCPPNGITCDPVAREILEPLLYISQYLQHAKLKTLPRLHLVTGDCWDLPPPVNLAEINSQSPCLAQAWGFMRSARMELTGISSKCIDLEMSCRIRDNVKLLATELWLDDKETEVVYRKGIRFVRRLKEQKVKSDFIHIPKEGEYEVELPKSKVIRDVKFISTCGIEQLEEHQVRIEVRSVSLNFKDVLAVLKPSSEFENLTSIGFDFSGVVAEVGRSVGRWKVGDAVFGLKPDGGCIQSHLIANENLLVAMPSSFSFTQSSTFPTVFLTAWHCMVNVAELKTGQTMLLHAASGGVGLAAIQIAKILGVHIIGTAGSVRKREFVRRLGVRHVFDSRTLEFKNEILKVTEGQGVDMVLNCLTGPGFKESSLAVCRDGGHFVEISKMDIWSKTEVRDMRPKVNYTILDAQDNDPMLQPTLQKLSELLEQGIIRPLHHIAYPANRISQALSYLQKAKHIGKVVINMPLTLDGERKSRIFNDRSSYLITAGKTGIGFEVCKWMIREHGAKYVVLVSRSQAKENVKQAIDDLQKDFGAVIICKEVDVSDFNQCKKLIEEDIKNWPPLKGVHHCAAILSDQLLADQGWSNFERVISPKARGAWNLHQLTMKAPLEHFVLYSSASSVFGNVGQTNYSCASSYLDNLAVLRKSMGLPAISINWGQWKAGLAENVKLAFFKPFSIEEGIQTLNYFMQSNHEQENQMVPGKVINFSDVLKLSPYYTNTFLEDIDLLSSVNGQNKSSENFPSSRMKVDRICLTTQLKQCADRLAKENVVKNCLLEMLCEILGTTKEDIRDDTKFTDMGMDSLMYIEFTNKINSALLESTSGGNDDLQGELHVRLDLEENDTLHKLTLFLVNAWDQLQ